MASRDLDLLHLVVREKCLRLLSECRERGLDLLVTQTARSPEEQVALYAQGRDDIETVNRLRAVARMPVISQERNKRKVTWVRTSVHQFGLAFDVCLLKGKSVEWSDKADINANGDPDYNEIGEIGEGLGLIWGGRFKGRDLVHFEWTGGLTLMELMNGKRPPDSINPQKKTGGTP